MPSSTSYPDPSSNLQITLHEPDARVEHVPEAVMHDIWRRLDFNTRFLVTTTRKAVEIVHPGTLNKDGGPDFSNAHIRIDGVDWFGDVELHRTSGEWIYHHHSNDPHYDRVILHVVLAADRHTGQIHRADGSVLPELVLLPHLTDTLRSLIFRFFAQPRDNFPCASSWKTVSAKIRKPWLRLLGHERLRARLTPLISGTPPAQNLEDVLYRAVMRALGYAPNADAMETLARRVPLSRVVQERTGRSREALLLGSAGLLPAPSSIPPGDPVTLKRVTELYELFQAMPESQRPVMSEVSWQFARLRPANSPVRRIAQAAALCSPGGLLDYGPVDSLRTALEEKRPITALRRLLINVDADEYWHTHIRVDVRCKESPAGIGRSRADDILQNALLPVLLLQAERDADYDLEDRVLDLLQTFPAASDSVTRMYENHGAGPSDALEAQGIHQLYRTRCTKGKCLSCSVGRKLLGR